MSILLNRYWIVDHGPGVNRGRLRLVQRPTRALAQDARWIPARGGTHGIGEACCGQRRLGVGGRVQFAFEPCGEGCPLPPAYCPFFILLQIMRLRYVV